MSEVLVLTAAAVREAQAQGAQVVDLRPGVVYVREHIPGSINIPFSRAGFAETAEYFLRREAPVVLVTDSAPLAGLAQDLLRTAGFRVEGQLGGGMSAWKQDGGQTAALAEITADQLEAEIRAGRAPRIIDVREPWEFNQTHIDGAELVPLSTVPQRIDDITGDERTVFVCQSGGRSGEAVQFLYRLGHRNAANLAGGMAAWLAGRRQA